MPRIFDMVLLCCSVAGIISEIITITVPDKILGLPDESPEKILQSRFYKSVFLLSIVYLVAVVLMLFSAEETFRIYAFVLLVLSLGSWLFRTLLLRYRIIQIAESTVCLILLLDVIRTIVRNMTL